MFNRGTRIHYLVTLDQGYFNVSVAMSPRIIPVSKISTSYTSTSSKGRFGSVLLKTSFYTRYVIIETSMFLSQLVVFQTIVMSSSKSH